MAFTSDHLGEVMKRTCAHCGSGFFRAHGEIGWRSPNRRGGPYCTRACAALARMAGRPPAAFTRGLPRAIRQCPRCESLLREEGGFLACHYGCGHRWPILGVAVDDAVEHERRAGIGGAL